MEDNRNQINYRKIKEEAEELARMAAEQLAEQEQEQRIKATEPANKSTGLAADKTSATEPANKSTGLAADKTSATEPANKSTGLPSETPAIAKQINSKGSAGNSNKPKKRRKRRNTKGILAFILIGIVAIIAASAWILNDAGKEKQAEISKADADIIVQGTEAFHEVKIPEVKARKNVSNNYHVISHRGYPAKEEEHSFAGYDAALDAGTMYIEQDIVTSADGTLYVSHDDTASRLTGNSGRFSDMTDAEIDELKTNAGNKILRLSDVFDRYGKTVGYVIELRDNKEATISAFEQLMDTYNMADNVILQSFEADVLETLEEKYPDMPKMLLCNSTDDRSRGISMSCVDIVCVSKEFMNEFGTNAIHNSGKKAAVYTIDAENHITEAIRLGVDYYFTDDTGKALSLEKRYRND